MIAAMLLMLSQTGAATAADIHGEWVNKGATAIIRIADCPTGLCGTVIWSTPKAQSDAARGGTAELNGTVVMSGFVPASERRWRGRLFLPDQNRMVRVAIELRGANELRVKGCELGGLVCRSQTWTRRSAG
ncbi:DUF2147 domain-containing protein [Sphingomonas segetis]|jgi:uncharacterized protein (DUF2147 family)|uniref:DUF2147 domain-containing protein n=1 Tax=Sphingomonas segetis TaxID=1104779 RepID=UPI0012D2ED96